MRLILEFEDTMELLKRQGVPVLKGGIANNEGEAVKIAGEIGFPVTLKPPPLENLETNVAAALNSVKEVSQKYAEIQENTGSESGGTEAQKVLVQRHAGPGVEAVIGMTRDAHLGPIVTFGLPGIFAFLKDISNRMAPVTRGDAMEMIKEVEAYSILDGGRGRKSSDIGAIADIIEKVSRLSMDNDDIIELDINPLIVYEEGAVVAGARIVSGRE